MDDLMKEMSYEDEEEEDDDEDFQTFRTQRKVRGNLEM